MSLRRPTEFLRLLIIIIISASGMVVVRVRKAFPFVLGRADGRNRRSRDCGHHSRSVSAERKPSPPSCGLVPQDSKGHIV
jgi:hypothetical protein